MVFGILSVLPPVPARAELSSSLLRLLSRPVVRTAFSMSAEGRLLADRLLGEGMVLEPHRPVVWHQQSEELIQALNRSDSPRAAEELYLRLLRLESRFEELSGARELSSADLGIVEKLAFEELTLRGPSIWSRMRGTDLSNTYEFAAIPKGDGGYSHHREIFLAGGGKGSPYERSILLLKELSKHPDAAYMLVETPEGLKISELIHGPNLATLDPAERMIDSLAADPGKKDLAISLAYRLDRAVQMAEAAGTRHIGQRGMRFAILRRVARASLVLRPAQGGVIDFQPIASGALH